MRGPQDPTALVGPQHSKQEECWTPEDRSQSVPCAQEEDHQGEPHLHCFPGKPHGRAQL